MKRFCLIVFFFFYITNILNGTIINVPQDEDTIQEGINASSDGDTVLVSEGTYNNNIIYNGKNIVVGSLFLITGDTSYISSTIIDGSQYNSVVRFKNGEQSAKLSGFTIQNGSAAKGGGIYVHTNAGYYDALTTPTLEYLVIQNNTATVDGGGVYCEFNAKPIFNNVKIINNSCTSNSNSSGGGGINVSTYAEPTFYNVIISNNTSAKMGGGVMINDYAAKATFVGAIIDGNSANNGYGGGVHIASNGIDNIFMTNFRISNNTGSNGAGISLWKNGNFQNGVISNNSGHGVLLQGSSNHIFNNVTIANNLIGVRSYLSTDTRGTFTNCIISNNDVDLSGATDYWPENFNFTYSFISEGFEGEGNLSGSPLFCGPAQSDFTLASNSPCIGSGIDVGFGTTMGGLGIGCGYIHNGPIWHVATNGSDESGDGSEEAPFATIAKSVSMAPSGDTIIVDPGEYFENIDFSSTKKLIITSNYATTGDTSYIGNTIINGSGNASVISFSSNSDSTKIIGFTITNGSTGISFYQGGNGGKANEILNCIIKDNNGTGVSIVLTKGIISNCHIKNNNGGNGGVNVSSSGYAIITDSRIEGNTAVGQVDHGGGMYLYHNSTANINNTIIKDNYPDGIECALNSTMNADSLMINNNDGHGIWVSGNSTVNIDGGEIFYNNGTGLFNQASANIANVIFKENNIGIYSGGNTTLTNVLIDGNNQGGINAIFGNSVNVINSTILNNEGHGIYLRGCPNLNVLNSIIYDNNGPQIKFESYTGFAPSNASVHYSDILGGLSGISFANGTLDYGEQNINALPLFCDAEEDDYRVAENSPCIGSGENGVNMGAFGIGCDAIPGPVLTNIDDQQIQEDDSLAINISAISQNGSNLNLSVSSDTSNVFAELNDTSLVVFSQSNWSGLAIITIVAIDEYDLTDTTSFTVTFTPLNDSPGIYLEEANITLFEDSVHTIDFSPFITDVDSDTSLVLTVSGNINIDVSIDSFFVTFHPDSNWYGNEEMIFTIDDNDLRLTDSDTIDVLVYSVLDPPIISDLNDVTINEDSIAEISLFAIDADDDSLFFYVDGMGFFGNTDPPEGIFSIEINQNSDIITIIPVENWSGSEWINIVVTDCADDPLCGLSDSTSFVLTVSSVNDAPMLTNLEYETDEDEGIWMINDLDIVDSDGDTIAYSLYEGPLHGTYHMDGWYFSENNYNGDDEFLLIGSDGELSDTMAVYITIYPVDDPLGSFQLLMPEDDAIISITPDNLNDTLWFRWTAPLEVDGEEVEYDVFFEGTLSEQIPWWNIFEYDSDTSAWTLYSEIAPEIDEVNIVQGEWKMEANDEHQTVVAEWFWLTIDATEMSLEKTSLIPDKFALHQNYPNPFNPITRVEYDLPEDSFVRITIYDLMGNNIKSLLNTRKNAGYCSVYWDATNDLGEGISAGMYIYMIEAGEFRQTKKMLLLK